MDLPSARRLKFVVSEQLNGWICERCGWSVRLSDVTAKTNVHLLFDAHDCASFALTAKNATEDVRS
jgi:hypothetical protein